MRNRVRFFLKHLSVSLCCAIALVGLVFFVWYPLPFYRVTGVGDIFFLLLCVDVAAGPLLAAVVYKSNKKEFFRDLSVIVIVQVAMLLYGFFSIAQGRPAWIVYNAGRFDLVQEYQIDLRHLEDAGFEYRNAPWFGAKWVAVREPHNIQERNEWLFDAVGKGIDIPRRPELYEDIYAGVHGFWTAAKPVAGLYEFNEKIKVESILKKFSRADGFLPLMARNGSLAVLVEVRERKIVAVVDLKPWF